MQEVEQYRSNCRGNCYSLPDILASQNFVFTPRAAMQIQRTIQTLDTPHLVIDLPASFAHQRVEILVMTIDDAEPKPAQKKRSPPSQFAGQVKELGDVMTSVSAADWGQV
jgi:hypothetical protein